VLKVIAWSFFMLLGLFMILSSLTGMNVAFTQSNISKTEPVTVVVTPSSSLAGGGQVAAKNVLGLRLTQGNWSDPYNDALWLGVATLLRETPSANVDVVLFDETSSMSDDVDIAFTAGDVSRTSLEREAKTHPDTTFVVLDNDAMATASVLGNLHTLTFEEHQASYLLGYLAGTLSQTGHVGFVGATKTASNLANEAAFAQGLRAACSQCEFHSERITTTLQETATAQTLVGKGTDIVFIDAGKRGQGVIDYLNNTMCASVAPTRPSPLTSALTLVAKSINYLSRCAGSYPLFFIGSGPFQPVFGDSDRDPDTLNHGLTSLVNRVDLAVYRTLSAFIAGNNIEASVLTLENGAVDLAVDDYNHLLIPEEVLTQLETIKARLVSGEIVLDKVLQE
jgi:basic membrane protein A and related proteins